MAILPDGTRFNEPEISDGWIPWEGGECPIPEAKAGEYEIKCRLMPNAFGSKFNAAKIIFWQHYAPWFSYDIIAYRLIKEPVKYLLVSQRENPHDWSPSKDTDSIHLKPSFPVNDLADMGDAFSLAPGLVVDASDTYLDEPDDVAMTRRDDYTDGPSDREKAFAATQTDKVMPTPSHSPYKPWVGKFDRWEEQE
jgi:hypothetical protein